VTVIFCFLQRTRVCHTHTYVYTFKNTPLMPLLHTLPLNLPLIGMTLPVFKFKFTFTARLTIGGMFSHVEFTAPTRPGASFKITTVSDGDGIRSLFLPHGDGLAGPSSLAES
jgi:hypothetical protein